MSFCNLCKIAIEETPEIPEPKPGTADRFYRLWDRPYDDFKQAASQGCMICEDAYCYLSEPSRYDSAKRELELSEEDLQKLVVTCDLSWAGSFDRLIINFFEWSGDDSDDGSYIEMHYDALGYNLLPSNGTRDNLSPPFSRVDSYSYHFETFSHWCC